MSQNFFGSLKLISQWETDCKSTEMEHTEVTAVFEPKPGFLYYDRYSDDDDEEDDRRGAFPVFGMSGPEDGEVSSGLDYLKRVR